MKIRIPPVPYSENLDELKTWLSVNVLGNLSKLGASFTWANIDKVGSNLADILTRNHNDLQNIQGGDSTNRYHLTLGEKNNVTNKSFPTLNIGDTVGGDYTEFEADGTLQFNGDATVWLDIDFPVIVRTTGVGIPTLTTLQGNITALQWAVNDFNVCEAQELVHSWKEGSEMQWHVHFVTNGLDVTDRYVNWEVEWFWADVDGQISSTTTTTSGDILIPANTPSKTMFAKEVAKITIPAHIGGHIWARLKRIASTGTAPTNNPWCSMLQLHIECDTLGSREIFTK